MYASPYVNNEVKLCNKSLGYVRNHGFIISERVVHKDTLLSLRAERSWWPKRMNNAGSGPFIPFGEGLPELELQPADPMGKGISGSECIMLCLTAWWRCYPHM